MAGASLVWTAALALAGYLVTYANNVRLENRKSRLKYLSDQIQFLYGPLFSLSHASRQAWSAFRSHLRPGQPLFDEAAPLSDDELRQWRLWMETVFMPLNLQMEAAVVGNAHLIEGAEMPMPFLGLLAHVESYRAVMKKWENKDFSQHTAYLAYPESLDAYVEATFKALTRQQSDLLQTIF